MMIQLVGEAVNGTALRLAVQVSMIEWGLKTDDYVISQVRGHFGNADIWFLQVRGGLSASRKRTLRKRTWEALTADAFAESDKAIHDRRAAVLSTIPTQLDKLLALGPKDRRLWRKLWPALRTA